MKFNNNDGIFLLINKIVIVIIINKIRKILKYYLRDIGKMEVNEE